MRDIRERGVNVWGSEGDRKATSAAMAPCVVDALGGIIRGRGSGSVYGTRRRGIALREWVLLGLRPWCGARAVCCGQVLKKKVVMSLNRRRA